MRKSDTGSRHFLARTASEARRYAVIKKVLVSLLVCLVVLSTLVYIISVLYAKYGSFTVSVNKYDLAKYRLSLSETPQFDDQVSRLNAKMAVDITNISEKDLPADIDMINGEHNGINHLAYTFYIKNVGTDTVTYEYYLFITNVTNDIDKAVRIRIYRDGEAVTYARTRTDGTGPEEGTVEFLTGRDVARVQVKDFAPGDVTKFTVAIWIEGDDPDCIDDLIGGSLKSDMTITVIEASSGTDGK